MTDLRELKAGAAAVDTPDFNNLIDEIEAGGGGGSVTEITSNDDSVTITNSTGPIVDLSASGATGPQGPTGPQGATGPAGPVQIGVPVEAGQAFWYVVGTGPNGTGTTSAGIYCVPVWWPAGITINRLAMEVTTLQTGSTIRMGVYGDTNGHPGTLLVDGGTVASTTTGLKEFPISLPISTAGIYWIAVTPATSGSFPAFKTVQTPSVNPAHANGYMLVGTALSDTALFAGGPRYNNSGGVLTTPLGNVPSGYGASPRVWFRVA